MQSFPAFQTQLTRLADSNPDYYHEIIRRISNCTIPTTCHDSTIYSTDPSTPLGLALLCLTLTTVHTHFLQSLYHQYSILCGWPWTFCSTILNMQWVRGRGLNMHPQLTITTENYGNSGDYKILTMVSLEIWVRSDTTYIHIKPSHNYLLNIIII